MKKLMLFATILIIGSISAVSFLAISDGNFRNSKMQKDYDYLQKEYDTLRSKYYSLLGNLSNLETKYAYILLQDPYYPPNPASTGQEEPDLSKYDALQELYSDLKQDYDEFVSDYQELRSGMERRLLRGNTRLFITPEEPEVVSLTYNITGKMANTTDPNSYWSDIKSMYDWVNDNIEYREDGLYPILPENPGDELEHTDQMAQFPNETLSFRSGDCEDIAILLTSMVRAYFDSQFTVECIWITGETAGHVAVQIPFAGEKMVILDPVRDYYSHDTFGNIALNAISAELYNWMSIWRPSLGTDVHVYRLFSDYMDEYYTSNEKYLDWMYNR